jgi:hypothetical protein
MDSKNLAIILGVGIPIAVLGGIYAFSKEDRPRPPIMPKHENDEEEFRKLQQHIEEEEEGKFYSGGSRRRRKRKNKKSKRIRHHK